MRLQAVRACAEGSPHGAGGLHVDARLRDGAAGRSQPLQAGRANPLLLRPRAVRVGGAIEGAAAAGQGPRRDSVRQGRGKSRQALPVVQGVPPRRRLRPVALLHVHHDRARSPPRRGVRVRLPDRGHGPRAAGGGGLARRGREQRRGEHGGGGRRQRPDDGHRDEHQGAGGPAQPRLPLRHLRRLRLPPTAQVPAAAAPQVLVGRRLTLWWHG